jgi:predicted nucleic acid-binding Zn ribbon protein
MFMNNASAADRARQKNTGLAAEIERDILRRESKAGTVTSQCALCGVRMVYRCQDYCSPRCTQYAADGFPAPDPVYARKAINAPLRSWSVVDGPPDVAVGSVYYADVLARYPDTGHTRMKPIAEGFRIICRGCQKEFVSLGERYCSTECGRHDRERQANVAVMAEVGIQPAPKRKCETCGTAIPKWRKGRRVPSATRFCSEKCQKKARRDYHAKASHLSGQT